MSAIRESVDDRAATIANLAEAVLQGRRLVLASNRGPIEYHRDAHGRIKSRRGSGGVVTALAALSRYVKLSWVASAMSETDRSVASVSPLDAPPLVPDGYSLRTRFVLTEPNEYELYYNVFSNPILWFVQHRLHGLLPHDDLRQVATTAFRNGYLPVNRAFAGALLREVRHGDGAPLVMLHDYHLYLTAGFVRAQEPCVFLQQFVHIPWPEPADWQILPAEIVRALCRGLLANDIVGFQTKRCAANFMATCAAVLPGARVDHGRGAIGLNGRRTLVRAYPISIDVQALRQVAWSPAVAEYERRLGPLRGAQTIVRVDRLDPSKNVLTGFQAFEMLLARRPDLRGRVKFLSFLVPSRTGIPEYRRYAQSVFAAIEGINARYGRDGWQPIDLFYENNYPQAIAGMRLYDVLMVNSSHDGMNLVSKEGPIVNQRDGVLVLSQGAGSHEELGGSALSIAPHDVEGTARALELALAMPAAERRRRAAALRATIESNDITNWLWEQMQDIRSSWRRLPLGACGPLSLPYAI